MPRGQKTVILRTTYADQDLYNNLVSKFRAKFDEINLSDVLIFLAQKLLDEANDELIKSLEEQSFSFTIKNYVTVSRNTTDNTVYLQDELEKAKEKYEEMILENNG